MQEMLIAMAKPMIVVVPLGVLFCVTTLFYQWFNNRKK
jgi:hypothetical protein